MRIEQKEKIIIIINLSIDLITVVVMLTPISLLGLWVGLPNWLLFFVGLMVGTVYGHYSARFFHRDILGRWFRRLLGLDV